MASLPPSLISQASYGLGLLSSFGSGVDVVGIYANGTNNQSGLNASGQSSSVLNSLLGTSGVTASFGQMFADARPLRAYVRETSRVMEHPVETGAVIADHHVINPVEIEIPLLIPSRAYAGTYSQIRQAFVNATLLAVKTRVGTYSNMIVAAMPHDEDAEMYDAVVVALRLRQVLFVVAGTAAPVQTFQPAAPTDSSTIARGLQSAAGLGATLVGAASSAASYAAAQRKGLI